MVRVTLTNPLPIALAHYEAELRDCLAADDPTLVGIAQSESIEGLTGVRRVSRGLSLAVRRLRVPQSDAHLVLWPALGYLDALTWVPAARGQPVILVMHDIDPLQPQFGHSRLAHRSFRTAVLAGRMSVVCHTGQAAARLADLTGVNAAVVPHPMMEPNVTRPRLSAGRRPIIRVLGQFKSARDLQVLASMPAEVLDDEFDFEIWGRGWPPVPGWRVEPTFLDETTFAHLAATASVVAIPYKGYSQSGVMVRAAESCVPVVGLPHPQLRFLYGDQWPGAVTSEGSWLEAARRAIQAEPKVAASAQRAHGEVRAKWQAYIEGVQDT